MFGAAQPLASPCQGEGDRRRRWKGGYVAESDIVTTGELRQERCNRRWDVSLLIRNDIPFLYVSTPQSRLRRASPPWQGGPRGLSNPANKAKAFHKSAKSHYPQKSNSQQPNTQTGAGGHDKPSHGVCQAMTGGYSTSPRSPEGRSPLVLFPRLFQKSRAPAGQATPGRVATLYLVRTGRHTGGKDSTSPPTQQRLLSTQRYLCRYCWPQRRPPVPLYRL